VTALAGPARLTANDRRTARQRAAIDAGLHPLTGERLPGNGETCGSCVRRIQVQRGGRAWPKCDQQSRRYATTSAATDVRASWPACPRWEPRDA
jgi:hypothetical protein